METENTDTKCKRSLEIEPSKETKRVKFSIQAVPAKGLESADSRDEEKSCSKKWDSVIKYNRKQKDAEKATVPGNNCSPQREIRSADHIVDEAPSKKFTGIEKSASVEMEQKDQEGCLAPTSISEPRAVFEVSVRQDPAFESQKELLPKKMVQDTQVLEKEKMEVLNHEAAQDEQQLEKKMKKISNRKKAQKEHHGSLKARVAELREETTKLSRELQKRATMCMQLSNDNKLLMDQLKKICEPCVIEILEAKNPDKNPQTD